MLSKVSQSQKDNYCVTALKQTYRSKGESGECQELERGTVKWAVAD
jgi:hypothetical protein